MRYIFDEFTLDVVAGELRRGESRVELRPKVYALLIYLIENRERLVSKEEILDVIWRDVHVSDGVLNRTIAELRQVLGDEPRESRFIDTVPRRGYRFVAPVTASTVRPMPAADLMLILPDRVVPLTPGEHIIGRTPECSVQIVAPSVSRRHARLVVVADIATIEDLGSTNGTFVADKRIDGVVELRDGDEIRIGKERLRLVAERTLRARTEPAI
ncbi:MAG TPA: FHA domain-containing protein [Thermoanaerobaculia bacterium]